MALPFRSREKKRILLGLDLGSTCTAGTFCLVTESIELLKNGKICPFKRYPDPTSDKKEANTEIPSAVRYQRFATKWGNAALKADYEFGTGAGRNALPGLLVTRFKLGLIEEPHFALERQRLVESLERLEDLFGNGGNEKQPEDVVVGSVRQSKRLASQEEIDAKPVKCKCNFTHHIDCIYCDRCETWQHLICCFGNGDKKPSSYRHRCKACEDVLKKEEILVIPLGGLSLEFSSQSPLEEYSDRSSLDASRSNSNSTIGPFGLPGDDDLFWGPKDSQVQACMNSCLSRVKQFVLSSVQSGTVAAQVYVGILNDNFVRTFVESAHGKGFINRLECLSSKEKPSRLELSRMVTALVASKLTNLVFLDGRGSRDSVQSLVLDTLFEQVRLRNGNHVLSSLKRESILSILRGNNTQLSRLSEINRVQAEELTKLFFQETAHVLAPPEQKVGTTYQVASSFSETVEPRVQDIRDALLVLLDLKFRLTQSDCHYGLYTPHVNTQADSRMMLTADGSLIEESDFCELCLMPALIQYGGKSDQDHDRQGVQEVTMAECHFVEVSDSETQHGRVVSRAVVKVSDSSN